MQSKELAVHFEIRHFESCLVFRRETPAQYWRENAARTRAHMTPCAFACNSKGRKSGSASRSPRTKEKNNKKQTCASGSDGANSHYSCCRFKYPCSSGPPFSSPPSVVASRRARTSGNGGKWLRSRIQICERTRMACTCQGGGSLSPHLAALNRRGLATLLTLCYAANSLTSRLGANWVLRRRSALPCHKPLEPGHRPRFS